MSRQGMIARQQDKMIQRSGVKGMNSPFNGVIAANQAVERATKEGSSMIFLTRSEYEDLIFRACLPELNSYKGKFVMVVSDPPAPLMPLC